MEITAAVVEGAGADFSLERLELDEPRPEEVLVRIEAAGVCHTDVLCRDHGVGSVFPAVLGHEGAGIVVRVGSAVKAVQPGDRVVLTFRSCGVCGQCTSGNPAYCDTMPYLNYAGRRLDGTSAISRDHAPVGSNFFGQSSFATYALTYETNLVKVPDDIPLSVAAPLGCGIQTGAGAVMRSLDCNAGSSIVIIGGGTVGLSATLAAKVRDCACIIVVEPMESRRALALEMGATHVIDPIGADVAAAVRAILPIGVDFVVDTTGRADILATAITYLRSRGALGLVGVPAQPDAQLSLTIGSFLTSGHRVIGIIEGDSKPDVFIPELLQLYREGRFPFDKLITTYPFEKINDAIKAQHQGHCIKPVLVMEP
ncbi:NAD(P)-dependent alcohol dehydrogenase [Aquisediminimonas sediminicola]|uniref:NAD(P)-dependent alcohol dehydrogenase n=1 Tax=Alteraquisediminimonas sediminicola TaxID=2676787 RepID=UPI001C8E2C5E|nr:NAD(P)-dependent alcohol dehydrogenase [Aquisediminimonas sediminicola]